MNPMSVLLRSLATGAVIAALATGCGSATSGTSTQTSSASTAQQVADTTAQLQPLAVARRAVLRNGDVRGFTVVSQKADPMSTQLDKVGNPDRTANNALVHAAFLAGYHSFLENPHHILITSSAQVWKTPQAAAKYMTLDGTNPGQKVVWLKSPPGTPVGARYFVLTEGKWHAIGMGWKHGDVTSLEAVLVPRRLKLNSAVTSAVKVLNLLAARAQDQRVNAVS